MFQFRSGNTNQVQPTLFDIRIQSQHKNVVMIKGSPLESAPVLLSGHVVISIPEDLHIKKISLNLTGTYKLDFLETYKEGFHSSSVNAVKAESTILKASWNNLLKSKDGIMIKGDYGENINSANNSLDVNSNLNRVNIALNELLLSQDTSNNNNNNIGYNSNGHTSTTSLSNLISSKSSKSSSNLSVAPILEFNDSIQTGETPFPDTPDSLNCTYKLSKGNYSLPFEVLLPGNIPETIEGLQCGAVLYRFESRIETVKSSVKHPLVAYKYIRIFRSPAPTDIVLNEDCSIENNWPNKIQYEVRIPRKAVPIGAKTRIHIFIVPLLKNMKLGKISATIHQFFYLRGPKNERFEDDKVIYKCELPEVSMDELSQDRWSLEAKIFIPNKLKQCSPDCSLRDDLIKIRHKLILTINLINPDGHTSQVKSKLPIVFYVSPNERVIGRNAYVDANGRVRFKTGYTDIFPEHSGTTSTSGTSTAHRDHESSSSTTTTAATAGTTATTTTTTATNNNTVNETGNPDSLSSSSNPRHHSTRNHEEIHVDRNYEIGNALEPDDDDNNNAEEEEFLPSYKDSGRDILFTPDMLSPAGYLSPAIRSGTQTPSYFDIEPRRPGEGGGATEQDGYFPPSGMASPAFQFLSRVNSSSNLTSALTGGLGTPSALDTTRLSEVPDYNNVYDLDYQDQDEPAPLYHESDITTPPSFQHLKHGSITPRGHPHSHSLPNHLDTHGGDRELADYLVSRILDSQKNRSFVPSDDIGTPRLSSTVEEPEEGEEGQGDHTQSHMQPIPIRQHHQSYDSTATGTGDNNGNTTIGSTPITGSASGSSSGGNNGVGAFGMSPSSKIRPTLSLGRHSASSLRNMSSFIGSASGVGGGGSKGKSNSAHQQRTSTSSSSTSLFRFSSSAQSSRNGSSVNLNSMTSVMTENNHNHSISPPGGGGHGHVVSQLSHELRETPSPPPPVHQHSRSPTSINFSRH